MTFSLQLYFQHDQKFQCILPIIVLTVAMLMAANEKIVYCIHWHYNAVEKSVQFGFQSTMVSAYVHLQSNEGHQLA